MPPTARADTDVERVGWDIDADSHWVFNTTIRCQHRCVYCFEGERRGLRDVPPDETMRLIDEASRSVRHVTFMGAEPTLNPHLPDLIAHATSRGLSVTLSTNGLRLGDMAYLRRLRDAGLVHIELSFHYPDEAVYSSVTRAHPKGFRQLQRALENLDELNAKEGWPKAVNVNLVVTRYNVDRLAEVVAHVRRLSTSPSRLISFKRVERPASMPEHEFLERIYVPCRKLRARLGEAARTIPPGEAVAFRNFPLCVLPGQERLEFDLGYLLRGAEIHHNFANQDAMGSMYPAAKMREAHPYEWLCDRCTLGPICLARGMFALTPGSPDDCPVPEREPIAPALREWLESYPRGRSLLDAPRPPTRDPAGAWLLDQLSRQPPEARDAFEPLESGVFLVRDAEHAWRLRPRRVASGVAGRWGTRDWSLAPEAGEPGDAPPPPVAAFVRLLDALPPAPEFGAPPPAARARLPWDRQEGGEPPVVRVTSGAGWAAFLAEALVPRARERLAAIGEDPAVIAGAEAKAVLLRPSADGELARVLLTPIEPSLGEGFLCGAVRLRAPASVFERAGLAGALAALAAAAAELDAAAQLPEALEPESSSFLRDAWRTFGGALLPRVGSAGALLWGALSQRQVRLGITTHAGTDLEIILVPADGADNPFARGDTLALQYRASPGAAGRPDVLRVIGAYAGLLTRAANGRPRATNTRPPKEERR